MSNLINKTSSHAALDHLRTALQAQNSGGKGNNFRDAKVEGGKVVFVRQGATTDARKLGKLSLEGMAARAATRAEIKRILAANHIPLTAEMKKALPSHFKRLNASALENELKVSNKNVNLAIKNVHDLQTHLAWEAQNLATQAVEKKNSDLARQILRVDSPLSRAVRAQLSPAFHAVSHSCADKCMKAFENSLNEGKSFDESAEIAYRALSDSLADVVFDSEFKSVAVTLMTSVVEATNELKKMPKYGDDESLKVLNDFKKAASENIVPAIILRSLMPSISDILMNKKRDGKNEYQFILDTYCTFDPANASSKNDAKITVTKDQSQNARPEALGSLLLRTINRIGTSKKSPPPISQGSTQPVNAQSGKVSEMTLPKLMASSASDQATSFTSMFELANNIKTISEK
jgi:hypothetical protein